MSLSRHDYKVRQVAQYYQNQGYQVQADINDGPWNKPDLIRGHYPDVIATLIGPSSKHKGEFIAIETVIVEVETELSKYEDHSKRQQEAFSRYAQENDNVYFKLVIA